MRNGPQSLPVDREALAAVFLVDLVFVGQIVPDRGDMKITGLDDRLHRLRQRRLHALLLIIRLPRRSIFKVLRVVRYLHHE